MARFVDSHFHLGAMQAKGIAPVELLRHAQEQGIVGLLDAGMDAGGIKERLAAAERFPGLYLAVGLSPAAVAEPGWEKSAADLIRGYAGFDAVVAVGEIGLDYYWNYGTKATQRVLFEEQLTLAQSLNLPVIIHNRGANLDLLESLRPFRGSLTGVLHCFTGEYGFAAKLLDAGMLISFAGNVTYKKSENLRDTAVRIPLDRMLVETDAPYLAPEPLRGKINSPLHIGLTYAFLASLRGLAPEELGEIVTTNFLRFIKATPVTRS